MNPMSEWHPTQREHNAMTAFAEMGYPILILTEGKDTGRARCGVRAGETVGVGATMLDAFVDCWTKLKTHRSDNATV